MNLMFRKNFAADKGLGGGERAGNSGVCGVVGGRGGSASGYRTGGMRGGTGVGRGAIRRSREFGYYPMDEHPAHSYRTHLFLSPPAGGVGGAEDSGGQLGPGPRRSSGPLIKWGGGGGVLANNKRKPSVNQQQQQQQQQDASEPPTPTASRQVSFSGGRPTSAAGTYTPLVVSGNSPPRGEPISLATLDRDCFIIPLASLESFLPAGVPAYTEEPPSLPVSSVDAHSRTWWGLAAPTDEGRKIPNCATSNAIGTSLDAWTSIVARQSRHISSNDHAPIADKKRPGSPLSVLEVEDPKQCVLAHLMTPLEPLDPLMESPVARPLVLQRDTAAELVAELAPTASQSILLTNMERNADFPFIGYYLINKQVTDPVEFYREAQCAALRKFDPRDLRYAANHTLDLYNEVATIARPPLEPPGGRPPVPSTGYIVSIFKVFEGDDGLKFEQNWLYWTGARMIYRYLPKAVGLRRITLHKSMSQGDKMYLLICECAQLQDNLSSAAILLPALRARLCGYTGLYRPSVCF